MTERRSVLQHLEIMTALWALYVENERLGHFPENVVAPHAYLLSSLERNLKIGNRFLAHIAQLG